MRGKKNQAGINATRFTTTGVGIVGFCGRFESMFIAGRLNNRLSEIIQSFLNQTRGD